MAPELPKTYNHQSVEKKWYQVWADAGYFQPQRPDGSVFSVVIPPPNVTGSLHMGHALNNTLQDILCRFKRMDGYNVLWVPGTDHAGIATQNVVERQLTEEGLTRAELGREKFIERVWSWRAEAGSTILRQLRALGVSCDWTRERFTMDEGLSSAVKEAFVRLWEENLLYRAERLINWCPRCRTALADIEVIHEETDGHLWYIQYPLASDAGEGPTVATTRPETMLGDTAVAVHPEDPRHAHLVGKRVRLPIAEREIPVIADSYVDREFGTGALKITPGHDFNDFEIGERFGLERINIFADDATICEEGLQGPDGRVPQVLKRYVGTDRLAARRMITRELEESGLLVKVEPYRHSVGHCYRCQTAIEPYLTPQWFVRVEPLAQAAMQAVREGRTRIIPDTWSNSFFAWMENIKDWCISRQIWWGHQIPAWYCIDCEKDSLYGLGNGEQAEGRVGPHARPLVGREPPGACSRCGGSRFLRDPDVLDTWFSSGLWPFSTLGWPLATRDLSTFYPTSTLVTGFDILFFWVARMMMMGLKFMGEVPFRHVYIHALVRDQEGQKMSKSKGNVIDPLIMIDRYGTDAFRFTLASLTAMGRDVKLSEDRIGGYQNFVNKLWNAARFVLLNLEPEVLEEKETGFDDLERGALNLADRWILSRLTETVGGARTDIESYRFNDFAHHLYQFTWHEFCDWYIEMSKLSLNGRSGDDRRKTQRILHRVLKNLLLLLHPLMPFVTEEIWQAVSRNAEHARGSLRHIMVQPYPQHDASLKDEQAEREVAFLIDVVRAIRNLRTEMNVAPSKEIHLMMFSPESSIELLRSQELFVRALTRAGSVNYPSGGERPRKAATAVVGATEVYMPLEGTVNLDEEAVRLRREIDKMESERSRIEKKLHNRDFMSKAREEVITREKHRARQADEKIQALHASLKRIEQLKGEGEASN